MYGEQCFNSKIVQGIGGGAKLRFQDFRGDTMLAYGLLTFQGERGRDYSKGMNPPPPKCTPGET